MSALLTPNTQAILLLTAPLIAGRSGPSLEPLTFAEYNRLARMLREKRKQPSDLIGADASQTIELVAAVFGRGRVETLLGRGFLLSQAVDHWNARAIWVVSRADDSYPRRIKAHLERRCAAGALWLWGYGPLGLWRAGDRRLPERDRGVGSLHRECRAFGCPRPGAPLCPAGLQPTNPPTASPPATPAAPTINRRSEMVDTCCSVARAPTVLSAPLEALRVVPCTRRCRSHRGRTARREADPRHPAARR